MTGRRKLIALDADDLAVISAHVQDAEVRVADIVWRPAEKRGLRWCATRWKSPELVLEENSVNPQSYA